MKKQRKIRRKSRPATPKMGILISALSIIVIAAGALMFPGFNVSEVYCEGCVNSNPADIISVSQIKTGGNILLVNAGRAEREILGNPLVEEVNVRRIFPDKICVSIKERVPLGYIMHGAQCVVIDKEGTVVEVINDSRVSEIAAKTQPTIFDVEKTDKEKDIDKEAEEREEQETPVAEDETQNNEEETKAPQEKGVYSIPMLSGLDIENVKEGKRLKSRDEKRQEDALEICNALLDAGLLNRTTYVDVADVTDVRIIIENRLDVQIGRNENIEYRAKFLAEVVNTKISAYEKVVVDYRGDDIYVRPPERGEDRVISKEPPENDGEDDNESAQEEDEEEE